MKIIKNKHIRFLILVLIVTFICCYYVANSGYYEYHLQERVVFTNAKIKEFEEDVKNNKDIDIKDYLEKEEDYTNKVTKLMYDISNGGTNLTRKIIKRIFKRLRYLIED